MQGIISPIAIAGFLLVIVIFCLSKAIYNVYFHPLSAYPGPWWMAVSDMVRLTHLASGRYVALNHRLHLLYGPIVRVGPQELSFIQPEAWKDIYGHSSGSGKAEFAKDPHFYGTTPNGVDHIGTANRQDHARMRSVFSHAFSERALRKQEPLIREHAQKMAQRMREHSERNPGGVVNILDMFNFAAFDITSELAFGEPLGLLDRDAYTPWVRALFDGVKFMTIRGAVLKVPLVGRLLQLLTERTLKKQFEAHFRYACDMVDRRLARQPRQEQQPQEKPGLQHKGRKMTPVPVPDIWSFVLGGDDKKRLSLAEMHSNASGFMIGGGETTSTTLSGVVYLLLRHPEAMRRLMEELRGAGVFESVDGNMNDRMSWSTLARLEYLKACLTETLRLFPPAAVGLPRIVPSGGAKICGNLFPEGVKFFFLFLSQSRSRICRQDKWWP